MKNKSFVLYLLLFCFVTMSLVFAEKKDDMDKIKVEMMENMKNVMMMKPDQMKAHIMKLQQASLEHGRRLFEEPGPIGISCSSCHPSGATTGGMAEPMPGMKIPVPSLVGSSGTFPKFKVPNNAVVTLEQMNNNCRMTFNKDKPFPMGSREGADLAAYVSSFSNGKKIELGTHNEMKMMEK